MELSIVKRGIIYSLLLIIFCGGLYLPSAVNRDLHYKEELKYVEVAREMVVNNQWLVPHFGGAFYADKPPVYFWILNFNEFIFGNYSTLAMALPSIISGMIIVLLTFYLGKLIFDERYGFLSGLILATSLLFFGLSIIVRMDSLMVMFITAALVVFYLGYKNRGKSKKKYYLLIYLFMGVATMIKGPAGFLVPLLVIPGFLLWEKNLTELKQMELLKGAGIFTGILLLWLVPALISGGWNYAYELLIVQTFGRAVNSFAHARPIYYYLMTYPVTFLPWSLFLIASFIYIIKNQTSLSSGVKLLITWFWLPFILFSLVSGKLVVYLLPIYPAAALLVSYLFKTVIARKASTKFISIPAILTLGILIVGGLFLPESIDGIAIGTLLRPTIISCLIGGVIGLMVLFKKRYRLIPHIIILIFMVLILNFSLNVVPVLSRDYTQQSLGNKLESFKHKYETENIVAYKCEQPASLAVYTGFIIKDVEQKKRLINYFKQKEKVLAVIKDDKWRTVHKLLPKNIRKIYSSNGYLVVYYD